MKRSVMTRRSILLALLLLMLALTPVSAAGSPDIRVILNGSALTIPAEYGTPFYDKAGRLQIPMRYIIESCGYSVNWDQAAKTATVPVPSGNIVITLGSTVLQKGTESIPMDTAAQQASDGRTYIPLRFALEALGCQVQWTRLGAYDEVRIASNLGSDETKPMTATQIAALTESAVFSIETFQGNEPFGSGSGFFLTAEGVAVTNYHVIAETTKATIQLSDGNKYPVEAVLHYDVTRDIAVIRASKTATTGTNVASFPFLKQGDVSKINNGDTVYAVGSPLGLSNSISNGIVSSKSRVLESDNLPYIQSTAAISPGSSGGALLNEQAEVIGITTSTLVNGQNLNLAVPIDSIRPFHLLAVGTAYKAPFVVEYGQWISNQAEFADNVFYENEWAASYDWPEIYPGETVVGTFCTYDDMDFYTFYTPVPVYLSVVSGGYIEKYDPLMDEYMLKENGVTWAQFMQSSLIMTLDSAPGTTFITSEIELDVGNNIVRVIDGQRIEPGRYYINVLQRINDETAWAEDSYFLYMTMERAF